MKILRSRVVPTTHTDDTTQRSKKPSEAEPTTPMEHQLTSSPSTPGSVPDSDTGRSLPPPPRRRSLRLLPRKVSETTDNSPLGSISELVIGDGGSEIREIEARGKVRALDAGPVESVQESNTSSGKDKGKRKLNTDSFGCYSDGGQRGCMSLRSGKSVAKRGKNDVLGESFDLDVERENDEIVLGEVGRVSVEKMQLGSPAFERVLRSEGKDDKLHETAKSLSKDGPSGSGSRIRTNHHSVQAVEEGNLVIDDMSNGIDIEAAVPVVDPQNADFSGNAPIVENIPGGADMRQRRSWERDMLLEPDVIERDMERFREIARENASRFARFNPDDSLWYGAMVVLSAAKRNDSQAGAEENQSEIDDCPGSFSTAMKIIRDRSVRKGFPWNSSSTDKSKSPSIKWVPRSAGRNPRKRMPPSLMDLCLKVLVANADAVSSLEGVPDDQRHKFSQLLCNSRKLNSHVFGLLIKGSPSEVRVKDCSWLTEEELDGSFKECDTSKLTVLQLDQCGRCLPDYILLSSIAKSANCLPLLSTVSITGACRLTDDGLARLALSAPTLESLNLSQCSLLTFKSIETLATMSGLLMKELHLDDCQSIDPVLILPALMKLKHLEVLSLSGLPLSDSFIDEFVSVQGHQMKELILRDCVNLTDTSFKVIGNKCSGLCSINLVNLTKLTDYSIRYLANGCQAIEKLVLCRNTFSDEAVAAFLEVAGEKLKELSLNNVKKVGLNTAISLAKTAKKLEYLDASWCRNLEDESLGLIVDSCLSLKHLRVFGCTQITDVFVNGHSNPEVEVVGLRMSAFLEQCRKDVIELPSKYLTPHKEH